MDMGRESRWEKDAMTVEIFFALVTAAVLAAAVFAPALVLTLAFDLSGSASKGVLTGEPWWEGRPECGDWCECCTASTWSAVKATDDRGRKAVQNWRARIRRRAVLASIEPRCRRCGVLSRTDTGTVPPPVACGKAWSSRALTVSVSAAVPACPVVCGTASSSRASRAASSTRMGPRVMRPCSTRRPGRSIRYPSQISRRVRAAFSVRLVPVRMRRASGGRRWG